MKQLQVCNKRDLLEIVENIDTQKTSKMLLFIALGTVFLDAYDLTILGTSTDQIKKEFHLSPTMLSVVMTVMPFGALFGAILGGRFADKIGRKKIFSVSLLLLIITALGAAFSPNVILLILCRFVMGFAIEMDSPVVFTYIAEISNKSDKGRNVNYWQVVWYISMVASALCVIMFFLLGTGDHLWRFAVGFGAVIALVLYILRLKYLDESPIWIVNHRPLNEAAQFVEQHYHLKVNLIEDDTTTPVKKQSDQALQALLSKRYFPRLALATAIATLQGMQYYAIGLYIPLIATYIIGDGKLESLLGTAIVNIAGIVGAYFGAKFTLRFGARKLTMIGFGLVLLAMLCIGLMYKSLPMIFNTLFVAVFLFGHAGGPGTQGKTIGAMSFPTSLRGRATGVVESVSRLGSISGTFVFPVVLAAAGLSNTMLILAAVPFVGFLVTFLIKWEPVGKNVENEA